MDPVVCIQIGDQKKYTSVKESTNCPYYNEVNLNLKGNVFIKYLVYQIVSIYQVWSLYSELYNIILWFLFSLVFCIRFSHGSSNVIW